MSSVGTGATIFGCEGAHLTPSERAFFVDADPMGFILFARNVENPDQLRRLTDDLRMSVGRDAPILIDQEGGRVQRLRSPHWREWLPPLDQVMACADLDRAAAVMGLRSRIMAAELRAVGIDANCAPVADIASDLTHPFLRNRCYGSTANSVTVIARAVAEGHLAEGVLPVVKHMPGHGRSQSDTHLDLPTVTTDRATLREHDFAPFRALADLPMAMTAHIIFAAHDDQNPATQSHAMIKVIREDIGFAGLLMTDDLNMQALQGPLSQRTRASLAAGCDIALHCKGDMDQMVEVAAAASIMGPATLARVHAALSQRRAPGLVDMAALDDAFARLTKG